MKIKSLFATLTALAAMLTLTAGAALAEQAWENPVIKAAGRIVSLPDAAVQPDPDIAYKIVFDITKGKANPDKVVPGLHKVARLINVFASAGMSPDKMHLALVMHGPSTEAVLKPSAYKAKHGFANPNQALIDQLTQAGVKLYVCGQALREHHVDHKDVSDKFTVALSALTVLPTYQLKGYAFLPF